jgi:polyphenol oxidase
MWQWRTWQELPYLTCLLLDEWQHGFFTRDFAPREPHELTPILSATASTHRFKQVHGNTVLTPAEADRTSEVEVDTGLPLADGGVSDKADRAIWVATADCNPVLIADRGTKQVAAVHAGWRGTALEIVPAAVRRLQDRGANLADIVVAIGPAIAGEVYQVSTQVGAEVCRTIVDIDETTAASADGIEAVVSAALSLPNSPLLTDSQPHRVRLDVRRVNALQLEKMGIDPSHIAVSDACTFRDDDRFFSYRREKLKKIQWSGIVSG